MKCIIVSQKANNPVVLLEYLKSLEIEIGRKKKRNNISRLIDIDILFHGDAVIETEELSLPHPMVSLRKFILIPFAEVEPDFQIPHSNLTIKDLINHCPDSSRVIRHQMDTQA